MSPKKARDTVEVGMDFAAFIPVSGSVYQVGTEWALVSGADSFDGSQDLHIGPPIVNGTVVYCPIARGVVGSVYRISYFVNDGQQQDIQLSGYLAIVPDVLDGVTSVTSGGGSPTPPPIPAPTLSLTASATSITQGDPVTLTWVSGNATVLAASGGWSGSQQLSGSTTITPAATATYTLLATGAGGSVARSVTVAVTPKPFTPVAHVYTALGVYTETVPPGATNVRIGVWGGGPQGGGAYYGSTTYGGGGSGSGGYSESNYSCVNQAGRTFTGNNQANGNNVLNAGTFTGFTQMVGAGGTPGYQGTYGGGAGSGGAGGSAAGGNAFNIAGNPGAWGDPTGTGNGGAAVGPTISGHGPYGDGGHGATGGMAATGPNYGGTVFYYT